jgi:MFS family permease
MTDRHARYGAATGIFFFVLVVLGFIVTPEPPAADASAAEVFEYIGDKQDTLHTVQLIFALAGFFFIWFIGTLRSLLAGAETAADANDGRLANTAFGAGLIAVATLMIGFGLAATAALHPAENGPQLTHALNDASLIVPAVGAPAAAVFFAANGLSILRSGFLPAWLGWLALVTAFFNLLGIGAIYTDSGVFAADGVLGFFIGFALFLIWTLAASIHLYRKLGQSRTVTA